MSRSRWMPSSLLSLALVTAAAFPASPTLAGEGEILFVNSFEGTGNVPQFAPVGTQSAVADRLLQVDIDTTEPANQSGIFFSIDAGPAGLGIQASTGLIQWTPTDAAVGTASVTVRAEDLEGLANTLTFEIDVIDPNSAPLIQPIGDQGIAVGDLMTVDVVADDPDPGDLLDFQLDEAPSGMTVDPVSGEIEWLPGSGDIGQSTVVVRATDPGGRFDQASFGVVVVADNRAPMLLPIDDRGAAPGVPVVLQAAAEDLDPGDLLTWSLVERPAGMSMDPVTGDLTWTPTTLQLGPHAVRVRVRDALGAADELGFQIFVDLNRAPVAVDDGGYRVERGDTLTVPAAGVLANDTDPNDDPLSSAVTQPPQLGALTLSSDGGFEYTPDTPVGTIGFELDWEAVVSSGGGRWMPIIANMDDDPQSEVLVNKAFGCCQTDLRSYDGLDGTLDWSVVFGNRELSTDGQPVVADIDLDGKPELIVLGGEPDLSPSRVSFLYAFEHDGSLKWVSEEFPRAVYRDGSQILNGQFFAAALTVADLDQDGLPEILAVPQSGNVQFTVWDHEGQLVRTVSSDQAILNSNSTHATTVDLDLDGDLEVVVGGTAWHHDGTLVWSLPTTCDPEDEFPFCFSNTDRNNFPRVANLDDDPYPELIRTRGANSSAGDRRGDLFAINHDGTFLWGIAPGTLGTAQSPLAVADLNLDGYADVIRTGPVNENYVEARDGRDGTLLWSATLETRHAGATVFDMDRDGLPEVIVYGRLGNLHVLDGQDGSSLLVFQTPATLPPRFTTPVFADIDTDGQAELVVSLGFTFGNTPAVAVYESPGNDWAPMRSIWNEWGYRVTNINDDLTIPVREKPHWLQPGLNQVMVNQRLPESRNEDENQDRFFYRVSDGELQSNEAEVTIDILPPNAGPRILSTAPELASPGFEYVYNVLAVDTDPGDQLSFTLAEGPAGMAIDGDGRLTWTPTLSNLGTVTAVISVADTQGVFTLQDFRITVRDPVQVPDLAGLTEAAAVAALQALDLQASPLRDTFSDTIPAGIVAAQSPPAGTPAAAGSGVAVDVSRGPVPVAVPRLVGLDLPDAQAALVTAGLQTGTVEWRNDSSVPRGIVVQQDPAPFSAAPPGSDMALVVSGGPRATIVISPALIPAGTTASVAVQINDLDGTPLDPPPDVTLSLDIGPDDLFGTPPTLNGTDIETGLDTQGRFHVEASFSTRGAETVSNVAAVLPNISDGPGGTIYTDFAEQLETYTGLIAELIEAVNLGDPPAIEALDQQLADLEQAVDLRRLRTMTVIAPEGGVLPSAPQALIGGLAPGSDDRAYKELALDLVALLGTLDDLVREGTVPDPVLAALNQDLAATASALARLEPQPVGVLESSAAITALLGTYAPRMLVSDIRAVRQELRDEGIVDADGNAAVGRFSLVGIMSASSIRQTIIKDVYLPYVADVARMMGAVIGADLLQPFVNEGAIAGIITGGSLAIHVFNIPNSVIEGFGFSPTLSPNNAVTMVGPDLLNAVTSAAQGLPGANDFKDINSVMDAVQTQLDNANNLESAWKAANSTPTGVLRGCLLDNRPGCRQLVYPDGFASVYSVDSGPSLPGPALILVRNLESGANAIYVANFVPTRSE